MDMKAKRIRRFRQKAKAKKYGRKPYTHDSGWNSEPWKPEENPRDRERPAGKREPKRLTVHIVPLDQQYKAPVTVKVSDVITIKDAPHSLTKTQRELWLQRLLFLAKYSNKG